jgi:catechol 2,3-dioxygenase-like lactoylglutathione lyase family enzyme
VIERYAFVAVTTRDLEQARAFWAGLLGFRVVEEEAGDYFMVDAGGLRLCVDSGDDDVHRAGGTDPVIGLKVDALEATLTSLERRGLKVERGPVPGTRGAWALVRDPDGRPVILSETD